MSLCTCAGYVSPNGFCPIHMPDSPPVEHPQAPQRHESTKGLRQTDVKFPPIHYIRRIATLEAQLSAALEREKENREKGEALCHTLGNLGIHIHKERLAALTTHL